MKPLRYYALRVAGVVFLVAALYLLRRDATFGPGVERAALAGSLLAAGLALGWSTYRRDANSEDEDRPFFDSALVYVGFWALHWALFALTLGTFQFEAVEPPFDTVVTPVLAGGLLVVLWAVAVVRGGVYEAADPRYWVAQYRAGKRSGESR